MDTTTIEITAAQKDWLDDFGARGQAYKHKVQELIERVEASTTTQAADSINPDDLAARIVEVIGADVGGPQVDDSEIARSVARELDYAHLADQVSEKVIREMEAQR
jgi:hypothetical protein